MLRSKNQKCELCRCAKNYSNEPMGRRDFGEEKGHFSYEAIQEKQGSSPLVISVSLHLERRKNLERELLSYAGPEQRKKTSLNGMQFSPGKRKMLKAERREREGFMIYAHDA